MLLLSPPAWSGGGPETTLLVVNADSAISLSVANEYIRLRDLPEHQVVWLENVPLGDTIGIDDFRRFILKPVRDHVITIGLDNEIDLIAYSAGFPYGVDFSQDLDRAGLEHHEHIGTVGSLTSLTYFMHRVLAGDMGYLHPRANKYFRPPRLDHGGSAISFGGGRGFRSRYAWNQGSPLSTGHVFDRYYLSVMLGYSGVRGNSLPEILDYIGRASGADGTRPDGTVYLMANRNVRSRVRQPLFASAITSLREIGRTATVITQGKDGQDGRIPKGRTDIIGLVAGARVFDWGTSESRMRPGAIAESFTSYGGHFSHGSQTKLSEFLRQGAAGSSGAVREPYSFIEKFPIPHLHRYYADGCSLAEAFYQSVSSPYQLIVIGDPLARPFARFSDLELLLPDADVIWKGLVSIESRSTMPFGESLERMELWVNGRLIGFAKGDEPLWLDTRTLSDGFHDLRLVSVASGPIETRTFRSWQIQINNHGLETTMNVDQDALPYGRVFQFSGMAKEANEVRIYQGLRLLATAVVIDGRWQASVSTDQLGLGQVRVHAVASHTGGIMARSMPLEVRVRSDVQNQGLPAMSASEGVLVHVRKANGEDQHLVLQGLTGGMGPREWRRLKVVHSIYSGFFEAGSSGLYEFILEADGIVKVSVNGAMRFDGKLHGEADGARIHLLLGRGWHHFEIGVDTKTRGRFPRATMAGPEQAFLLTGEKIQHIIPQNGRL